MKAAAQHFWLEARLSLQRDEAAAHRPLPTPHLFQNAEAIVRDVAHHRAGADEPGDQDQRNDEIDNFCPFGAEAEQG